jgi:hypothetical protein
MVWQQLKTRQKNSFLYCTAISFILKKIPMTTIKLKSAIVLFGLFSAFILFSHTTFSQDQVVVWMHLDMSATHENYWIAGNPSTTVNSVAEISFKRYGFYTITRIQVGNNIQYMAVPGRNMSGRMPQVTDISVIMSHPCVDGEGSLIGRETRNIPARIEPSSGTLVVSPAANNRLTIHLTPTVIDAEMLECTNPNCQNGFGFEYGENVVGEDRDSSIEDEYGSELVLGYDLLETDFKLLKEIAEGKGDIPLTIPVSIEKVWRDEQDTPTGPESRIFTYRVNGWIGGTPRDE